MRRRAAGPAATLAGHRADGHATGAGRQHHRGPTTPLDAAVAPADRFDDAATVVADGWRHGVYAAGNSCVYDLVSSYLADPKTVSGRSTCPAVVPGS